MLPPMAVRRWQKSPRIYVRPRTGPQYAHLWWPAVAEMQAASAPIARLLRHAYSVPIARLLRHGRDRRTDRDNPKCPPSAWSIITENLQTEPDALIGYVFIDYYCQV